MSDEFFMLKFARFCYRSCWVLRANHDDKEALKIEKLKPTKDANISKMKLSCLHKTRNVFKIFMGMCVRLIHRGKLSEFKVWGERDVKAEERKSWRTWKLSTLNRRHHTTDFCHNWNVEVQASASLPSPFSHFNIGWIINSRLLCTKTFELENYGFQFRSWMKMKVVLRKCFSNSSTRICAEIVNLSTYKQFKSFNNLFIYELETCTRWRRRQECDQLGVKKAKKKQLKIFQVATIVEW